MALVSPLSFRDDALRTRTTRTNNSSAATAAMRRER